MLDRLSRVLVASSAFVLSACGPSESAIQTAISETALVPSPPPPSATPVDLSSIQLDHILLLDGDLPTVFVGQQIISQPPNALAEVPLPVQAINRAFRAEEFGSDGVTILLYASPVTLNSTFETILAIMNEDAQTAEVPDIGERAALSLHEFQALPIMGGSGLPASTSVKLLFTRCQAIVYVDLFSPVADSQMVIEYSKRLDTRITGELCP